MQDNKTKEAGNLILLVSQYAAIVASLATAAYKIFFEDKHPAK